MLKNKFLNEKRRGSDETNTVRDDMSDLSSFHGSVYDVSIWISQNYLELKLFAQFTLFEHLYDSNLILNINTKKRGINFFYYRILHREGKTILSHQRRREDKN